MKTHIHLPILGCTLSVLFGMHQNAVLAADPPAKGWIHVQAPILNPKIDYETFLKSAQETSETFHQRSVSEEDFLKMAAETGTLILDARSKEKFAMLHIKGAVNLNLSDFTEDNLKKVIPDKNTRILIYCNNNFENEPVALALKRAPAALNIHTFNTLYHYGYTNVYQLGPLLDIKTTRIPFEGTRAPVN